MPIIGISPNTTIKLLHNVSLDGSYRDTFYFGSLSAQSAFFNSKVKYTISEAAPVRMQQAVRVPIESDLLYDCNYLMFQNTNFSNKWFYAFITRIDFINVNMSLVHYQLDVMQSWAFDYILKPSFVVREHSLTDEIGDNLVPENLETGEYIYENSNTPLDLSNYKIKIASTINPLGEPASGTQKGGIYSGAYIYEYDTAEEANTLLDYLTENNKSNAVVAVYMSPPALPNETSTSPGYIQFTRNKPYNTVSGYEPKNKKLFTYPYKFLTVNTLEGSTAEFRYEYFGDENVYNFKIENVNVVNPEYMCTPHLYKGGSVITGFDYNYNESLSIANFPQCSYNIDSYAQWLSANVNQMGYNALSQSMAVAGKIAGGDIAGAGATVINTIAGYVSQAAYHSSLPPQSKGSQGSSISVATHTKNFHFNEMSITSEFAKIIDDYFSMFGYATNEVKIPNINVRPSWNYVKTVNSSIVGSIPFDDIVTIRNNFDRGITFWMGDFVGDYTRNNSPVGD